MDATAAVVDLSVPLPVSARKTFASPNLLCEIAGDTAAVFVSLTCSLSSIDCMPRFILGAVLCLRKQLPVKRRRGVIQNIIHGTFPLALASGFAPRYRRPCRSSRQPPRPLDRPDDPITHRGVSTQESDRPPVLVCSSAPNRHGMGYRSDAERYSFPHLSFARTTFARPHTSGGIHVRVPTVHWNILRLLA